jgi:hypothetical protein
MTLQELKSQAYDALVQIENWQMKLKETNQQIMNWKEEEKPVEVEEVKTTE